MMPTPLATAIAIQLAALAVTPPLGLAAEVTEGHSFVFGEGRAGTNAKPVPPTERYSDERGYGFEGAGEVRSVNGSATSDQPFFFSVRVPEGNHRVTVTLAGGDQGSTATVKAEARRLMLERVAVPAGEQVTRTFTVNVRGPKLPGGQEVNTKDSERTSATWDDKLTLEFNGDRPALAALAVEPAPDAVTVFVAGDSTVVDGRREPWSGWGQMLPRFFGPDVAVANYAESGRSLRSFRGDRRLDKILASMKPGDYLFIQFGHNDMKEKGEGVGAFTSFAADLKSYVAAARERGATPVLVTPMHRRRFDDQGKTQNSHGDYPEAVRRVAVEEKAPLIDLHATSAKLYDALGVERSTKAFVFYPANTFPDQAEELKDNSHHNPYGAYQLAKCVVEGIRSSGLPLASQLAPGLEPYDPSKPDPADQWVWPATPSAAATEKPEGS